MSMFMTTLMHMSMIMFMFMYMFVHMVMFMHMTASIDERMHMYNERRISPGSDERLPVRRIDTDGSTVSYDLKSRYMVVATVQLGRLGMRSSFRHGAVRCHPRPRTNIGPPTPVGKSPPGAG